MSDEAAFTTLGRRLVAPGVSHFVQRASGDTVPGVACRAAAMAAGEALESMCLQEVLTPSGANANPFTRRRSELTATSVLRAMRLVSAHFLIVVTSSPEDAALLGHLTGVAPESAAVRLFATHAEVFELGPEGQRTVAEYRAAAPDAARYRVGLWGLATGAAFGVRHLEPEGAEAFTLALDAALETFSQRLVTSLKRLVEQGRVVPAGAATRPASRVASQPA